MRARRSSVLPTETADAGARAAEVLGRHLLAHPSRPVGSALLYADLAGEVDTAPLDRLLRQHNARVAYPRVSGARLALHLATIEELGPGRFNVREPPATTPRLDPAELDLIIVPGLAFDSAGGRLGFGGSYYDRLLALAPKALRCGLALPFQRLDRVPLEEHDQRLDLLIVDDEILVFPASDRSVTA